LTKDATDSEIKKAYRRLALLYHPDKTKDASEDEKVIKKKRDGAFNFYHLGHRKLKVSRHCRGLRGVIR